MLIPTGMMNLRLNEAFEHSRAPLPYMDTVIRIDVPYTRKDAQWFSDGKVTLLEGTNRVLLIQQYAFLWLARRMKG